MAAHPYFLFLKGRSSIIDPAVIFKYVILLTNYPGSYILTKVPYE